MVMPFPSHGPVRFRYSFSAVSGPVSMNFLFHAHSGLRYLVLITAVAAGVYFVFALITNRTSERPARLLTAAFVGFLDLQILLGVLLMASGIYYPALTGHLVMMLLAAAAAHGASVMARRTPGARRALQVRLVGVVLAFALIAGGIMSIGRSLFGSGAPSSLG